MAALFQAQAMVITGASGHETQKGVVISPLGRRLHMRVRPSFPTWVAGLLSAKRTAGAIRERRGSEEKLTAREPLGL